MFIPFLTQLAGQSPLLLAYFVGIALALAFWRRYPRPSAFTLVAMLLLILISLGQTMANVYLVVYRGGGVAWSPAKLQWALTANMLVGSLTRALALGLLLAAAFADREPAG